MITKRQRGSVDDMLSAFKNAIGTVEQATDITASKDIDFDYMQMIIDDYLNDAVLDERDDVQIKVTSKGIDCEIEDMGRRGGFIIEPSELTGDPDLDAAYIENSVLQTLDEMFNPVDQFGVQS